MYYPVNQKRNKGIVRPAIRTRLLCPVIAVLCFFHTSLQAQEKGRPWSLQLGASYVEVMEQQISKLVGQGPSLHMTLTKSYPGERWDGMLELQLSAGLPKTDFESGYRSVMPALSGKYRITQTRELDERNSFRFGGFAQAVFRNNYYKNLDQSRFYWTNFIGAGLSTGYDHQLSGDRTLYASLDLPLLGAKSRPPRNRYYRIDDISFGRLFKNNVSNLSLGAIDTYFNPSFTAGIRFADKRIQALSYFFEYCNVKDEGLIYRQVNHGLALTIKLGK
ncbi:MAG: hypothetical protein EOO05_00290 [Chitinophagaceae bacterium]|nr:MAG: hypothetical protein EOO05_00290 [Chitinophagaceae bacterium]